MPKIESLEELQQILAAQSGPKNDTELTHTVIVRDADGRLFPIDTRHVHPVDHGVIFAPDNQEEDADHGESTMIPWYRVFEIQTVWKKKVADVVDPEKPGPYL